MGVVKLKVEVPDDILLTTRLSKKGMVIELKKITAMELYKEGKLSLGKASRLADLCLSDFIEFLGEHKISIFDYTEEELKEDCLYNRCNHKKEEKNGEKFEVFTTLQRENERTRDRRGFGKKDYIYS